MAIQKKSEYEEQQLREKANVLLQNSGYTAPAAKPAAATLAEPDTASEIVTETNPPQPAPLSLRQRLRAIPGLGYALSWFKALLLLPRTRIEIADLRAQLHHQNLLIATHKEFTDEHSRRIHQLESEKLALRLAQYDALDIGKRLMELDRLYIGRQLRSLNLMMRTQLQSGVQHQQNPLQPADNPASATLVSPAPVPAKVTHHFDQDQFYLEFEALFRGTREDIKQRLNVYLPYLSHISKQPRDERKMVIDVGCGRGEWLELLDEQGIPALGVDMNVSMVNACLDRGLLVRHADAIAYLREQPAGSIGAVTGFQIIEHLPFEQLIALFDAALHALCPGGVIIFETPNPENLKVGACNFYFDPTHLNPIVPQVAEFMARQRGFSQAEILRLHPYPDDHLLKGGSEVEALLNKELFGAQDYAVIGRK
ncbi:class I SAM-dependent methyltransferase [Undibacterium sp. TS12]|uniref:class I SAM-dependent methyltransferase n=1 Tax=Undibacterium sp. TS12 TaxID=2908202 RepID=UPI001F4C8D53|nr:class I SAM-dependent methyltransferase [Undibacterium sp. TS12]MCH8621922.1 class I SAM-dependent methyltransferase [Undibacterium sp. TS12]